jgi:PiT family inorganic phosphate transporter
MPESALWLFTLAVVLAYVYAFVGGFTDAANAIATSIGTRVLSPRAAVVMAGFFNLLGGLTGTAVAVTIGRGIIDPSVLSLETVVAGLAGAMAWSLLTYFFGLPVSETHGLIGGLVGAGVATAGMDVIKWDGLTSVLAAIVVSPIVGFSAGLAIIYAIYFFFRYSRRGRAMRLFKNLQRASAAYMAFSHGRNDAQKPMGVLALALALYFGWKELTVPIWVVVSCAAVAATGTAYGGWRIIRTLGLKLTALDPVQGFAAEFSAAGVIQVASELGIPISTTHTITSAILGVGTSRRWSAVRWGVTGEIFLSWVLTLPVTITLGGLFFFFLRELSSRF